MLAASQVSCLTSSPPALFTVEATSVKEEVCVSKEQVDTHNAGGGMWAVLQDQVVVDLQMMTKEVGRKPHSHMT